MSEATHRPSEFYGKRVTAPPSAAIRKAIGSERCPFLERKCNKQRKSDSSQTIGACAVEHSGSDLVICPHRFLQRDQIFLDCVHLLKGRGRFYVVPEITVPGGIVDYILVLRDGSQLLDYIGIEIQALDTTSTGGIWDARTDIVSNRVEGKYGYGINWRMSAKTILMQLHHKAEAFDTLKKKLVLVLQEPFMAYIEREFTAGHLRAADPNDPVWFHTYNLVDINGELVLVKDKAKSTNVKGIGSMLGRAESTAASEEEIRAAIEAKFDQAFEVHPSGAGPRRRARR